MAHKETLEVDVPVDSRIYTGMPIVISGPLGVGKSTIGEKIAKKMGVPFYDIDNLITKKVGMKTTREIIEKKGRPYFWEVENMCLKETFLKKKGKYVFAFGGTICNPANPHMKLNQFLTKKYAFNICLIPSPNLNETVRILWPRHENSKRATVGSSHRLQSYLKLRIPEFRNSADRIIYTYEASIEKIVDTILKLLKQ